MSAFLDLPPDERQDIFLIGQEATGRGAALLEKDVWIVWALDKLFSCPGIPSMTFKGGTSLSKVYNAISRFSEDVDVTMKAEDLAPGEDIYPETVSSKERKRLRLVLEDALQTVLADVLVPHLRAEAAKLPFADLSVGEVEEGGVVRLEYTVHSEGSDYLRPEGVQLEFGGRNAIEPSTNHAVKTYLEGAVPELEFPVAPSVDVLSAERTFWEKVTLAHSESRRPEFRNSDRMARHWYDLSQLTHAGTAASALARKDILEDVVRVKHLHYYTGTAEYALCLNGGAALLPDDVGLAALQRDYDAMVAAGMFDVVVDFDDVVDTVRAFENEMNALYGAM